MKKKTQKIALYILAGMLILVFFVKAVSGLESGQEEKTKDQLETAVRRAAVACYAAEGAYPEDLAYMKKHYGIRFDEERYTVIYNVFASNLMPDITVLDNEP